MRIIIISSNMSEVGGIQRLTATLANSFINEIDGEVHIINNGIKKGKEKFYIDRRIKNIYTNIEYKDLDNKSALKKLLANYSIYLKIKKFYKQYKLHDKMNIFIAMGHTQSCLLPYVIKKDENVRLIGSQHNPISNKKIYYMIRKMTLNKLDKYVLLNNSMQSNLLNIYNLKNTCVIENPNQINSKISKGNNNTVIAVGRLTEQKQFNKLIDIWKKVSETNPTWKLKIIGDGPLKNELNKQIAYYGLESTVCIKNFNDNIEEDYYNADILAMTSKYEGFGLVLVESQSCGVPTIAFDCQFGPKNIINNGEDGYLISNNDSDEFANKLEILMKDKVLRNKLSEKAIINSKRFDIKVITKKWLKLFDEIT